MFRLKRYQSAPTLPTQRLWTVGASASIALSSYILVGYCINRVAGPATLVSVMVSSALAIITGLAYMELTRRTRVTGSPYSFSYTYLGELPAFVVGWAVVGECGVGAALMAKGITYYISFLTDGGLLASLASCCSLGGVQPKLWNFFDPVAMAAVIIVGGVCAINSHLACKLNQVLLLINFATILLTIVVTVIEGSTDSWSNSTGDSSTSIFVPEQYGAHGVFQASAIYMHVFLTLATTTTLATQARGGTYSSAISMVVTLIVAIIAVVRATSVSLLDTYDKLNQYTPVATYMKAHDLTWAATINCLGAIVASTAGILSMLVLAANTLEQMASDALLWSRLGSRRPAVSPTGTTLIVTVLTAIIAALQDFEGLILCLSSGTFLVFQALLIAVMVSRSHASQETALLIVLKFTWLLYFFITPALVIIANELSEKRQVQTALQGLLSGVVLMFLQLAINRHQLDLRVVAVQVFTSLVMGFSSYLMYQLHQWAWYRLFIWTFLGLLIYTLYGYRKSNLGRGIVDVDVVPHTECVRSLEEGFDNAVFRRELADIGVGGGRRTHHSIGGRSYASARSEHRQSFRSAREVDLNQQSFRSVREADDRLRSFKSALESDSSGTGTVANRSMTSEPQGGRRDPAHPPTHWEATTSHTGRTPPSSRRRGVESLKSAPGQGDRRKSFQSVQEQETQMHARIESEVDPQAFEEVQQTDLRKTFPRMRANDTQQDFQNVQEHDTHTKSRNSTSRRVRPHSSAHPIENKQQQFRNIRNHRKPRHPKSAKGNANQQSFKSLKDSDSPSPIPAVKRGTYQHFTSNLRSESSSSSVTDETYSESPTSDDSGTAALENRSKPTTPQGRRRRPASPPMHSETTTSHTARTPPSRRHSKEILINPRKLYEELCPNTTLAGVAGSVLAGSQQGAPVELEALCTPDELHEEVKNTTAPPVTSTQFRRPTTGPEHQGDHHLKTKHDWREEIPRKHKDNLGPWERSSLSSTSSTSTVPQQSYHGEGHAQAATKPSTAVSAPTAQRSLSFSDISFDDNDDEASSRPALECRGDLNKLTNPTPRHTALEEADDSCSDRSSHDIRSIDSVSLPITRPDHPASNSLKITSSPEMNRPTKAVQINSDVPAAPDTLPSDELEREKPSGTGSVVGGEDAACQPPQWPQNSETQFATLESDNSESSRRVSCLDDDGHVEDVVVSVRNVDTGFESIPSDIPEAQVRTRASFENELNLADGGQKLDDSLSDDGQELDEGLFDGGQKLDEGQPDGGQELDEAQSDGGEELDEALSGDGEELDDSSVRSSSSDASADAELSGTSASESRSEARLSFESEIASDGATRSHQLAEQPTSADRVRRAELSPPSTQNRTVADSAGALTTVQQSRRAREAADTNGDGQSASDGGDDIGVSGAAGDAVSSAAAPATVADTVTPRPLLRRQMRLPAIPARSQWLTRAQTPADVPPEVGGAPTSASDASRDAAPLHSSGTLESVSGPSGDRAGAGSRVDSDAGSVGIRREDSNGRGDADSAGDSDGGSDGTGDEKSDSSEVYV